MTLKGKCLKERTKIMKHNTVCVRNEMIITSYGNHTNGNCKKILAVELQKVFNSLTDAADFFGVDVQRIWNILNGYNNHRIGYWERDENGNKIRRICMVRLTYLAHFESSVDALMECGRESTEKLSKANKRIAEQDKEIAELNEELAEFRAWKAEQEAIRKAEEKRQKAIANTRERIERRKAIEQRKQEEYQLAIARRQEAERELEGLEGREI